MLPRSIKADGLYCRLHSKTVEPSCVSFHFKVDRPGGKFWVHKHLTGSPAYALQVAGISVRTETSCGNGTSRPAGGCTHWIPGVSGIS